MSLKITTEAVGLLDMVNRLYGEVLNVSDCVNQDYDDGAGGGFANGTPTGFDAVSDGVGSDRAGTADEIIVVSGTKYRFEFDMVLNSGTAPFYDLTSTLTGGSLTSDGDQLATAGSNVFDFTCNSASTGTGRFRNVTTATDYEITNLSIRVIL